MCGGRRGKNHPPLSPHWAPPSGNPGPPFLAGGGGGADGAFPTPAPSRLALPSSHFLKSCVSAQAWQVCSLPETAPVPGQGEKNADSGRTRVRRGARLGRRARWWEGSAGRGPGGWRGGARLPRQERPCALPGKEAPIRRLREVGQLDPSLPLSFPSTFPLSLPFLPSLFSHPPPLPPSLSFSVSSFFLSSFLPSSASHSHPIPSLLSSSPALSSILPPTLTEHQPMLPVPPAAHSYWERDST